MKAKAKHWVKYGGVWHGKDEAFDIDPAHAEEMRKYAQVYDEAPAEREPQTEPEQPRRGRKRKAEE